MKNKILIVIFTLICSVIHADASSLFDYRGMFSAGHKSDAIITNYMLIKRPVSVKFIFETPDGKSEDRVKLTAVLLTSNKEISFHDEKGILATSLPESGIYELRITSKKEFSGELKFILKVYEQDKVVESETIVAKDLNLVKVEKKTQLSLSDATIIGAAVPDSNINSNAEPEVPNITTVDGSVADVVNNTESVSIAASSTLISIASNIKSATDSIELGFALASSTDKVDDVIVNSNILTLVEPSENSYINPYNGFKFEVSGKVPSDTVQLKEYINVTLWKKSGVKEKVTGSFYSEGPGSITFLPSEVIAGAIYHVQTLDLKTNQPNNTRTCAALPIVTGQVMSNPGNFVVQLTWEQNPELLPNSNGQIVRLTNMIFTVLSASGTNIVEIPLNEKMPPVAYVKGCKIQGAPYQLVFTIPTNLEGNKILQILSVLTCKMSGNTSHVEVLKLKSELGSNHDNTNIDFSNVTALPRDADDIIDENTVATLPTIGNNVTFKLIKTFKICNDSNLSKVVWPQDICWDKNGNIWLLDSQRRKIYNFSENGRLILEFGEKGNSAGMLGFPTGLIYRDGFLFVADMRNHCVHKFLLDGTYSGVIPSVSGTKSELKLPSGLCFRNKEMWITDKEAGRVLCFDAGKAYLGGFSLKSLEKNSAPMPISVRASGDILFILQKNGSVHSYSPMGKYLHEVIGETKKERSISVSKTGYVFVAEPDEARVKRYSSRGNLLQTLDLPKGHESWMPICLAQRDDGKLVIADAKNKQIYIFQVIPKE